MSSNIKKFADLAERISDQYVRLIKDGVNDPHQIFNRMMSILPELHELWTNTSDYELAALSMKYPDFMNFCKIVENLSIGQSRLEFRDYDGEQKLSEEQRTSLGNILGGISRIHEKVLELKQNIDNTGIAKLVKLKHDLERWRINADEFIDQLKGGGASEYVIKTVGTVFTENYNQANTNIQITEDYESDFIFSYLEDNDVEEFQNYLGTNYESLLVAGRKTIIRLERYIPEGEFFNFKVILTALVRDFKFPPIRYTHAIALGLYVATVEQSLSVPQNVKSIAGVELALLMNHLMEDEKLAYERDSQQAYSRWNEYLQNPNGFVI